MLKKEKNKRSPSVNNGRKRAVKEIWIAGNEANKYVNTFLGPVSALQKTVKDIKSNSPAAARKALFNARKAQIKIEDKPKDIIIVKRITMAKSSNVVDKLPPQVAAYNEVSVLYAFLANAFDEETAHDTDKKIVAKFKTFNEEQKNQEVERLESIAFKFA